MEFHRRLTIEASKFVQKCNRVREVGRLLVEMDSVRSIVYGVSSYLLLLSRLLSFPPVSARSGTIYSQQLPKMKYVLVSGGKIFTRMKKTTMLTSLGVISGIGKGVIGMHFHPQLARGAYWKASLTFL